MVDGEAALVIDVGIGYQRPVYFSLEQMYLHGCRQLGVQAVGRFGRASWVREFTR
jgi:hypothetical protein